MAKAEKVNVGVNLDVSLLGEVRPTSIKWPDGRKFTVDRVLDIKPAACLDAGVAGIRYLCRICGKEVPLFDDNGRWYLVKNGY